MVECATARTAIKPGYVHNIRGTLSVGGGVLQSPPGEKYDSGVDIYSEFFYLSDERNIASTHQLKIEIPFTGNKFN